MRLRVMLNALTVVFIDVEEKVPSLLDIERAFG